MRRSVDEFGQTIAMVTHDPRAASVADRVLFLSDGRIVLDRGHLDPAEILDIMKSLE
jgi:putative ABC transport system ATP-binding protein